jgi:hypothetical protein
VRATLPTISKHVALARPCLIRDLFTCWAIEELDDGHPCVQDGLNVTPAGIVPPQQLHDSLFDANDEL